MFPIDVATVPRSATEEIRFALVKFRGRVRLDVRIYGEFDGQPMRPTQKGVQVDLDALPDFLRILNKAAVTCRDMGLLPAATPASDDTD